ncbi:hypothetical protein CAPTEDRAFT_179511 [Capitella teleta]|uniref:Hypoxia up-regulated protein 1 n=1 Tax=Capitella teleta TaxID=283909 RepID=R7TIH0_CAPTE|nr:hypothetical protein CAPTEDRAFT_179511 [Capitella teleta]|eukprot:ELT93277.1 hypothetical protein CAPTEDRAFT_179511 [Capitella teleta]
MMIFAIWSLSPLIGVRMRLLCSAAFLLLAVFHFSDGLAVMSIDLGSEFMKVAIVKPGVPMEIVLNEESRRKTNVIVAMRNGERMIGEQAKNSGLKKPSSAYWFFGDLLGRTIDNPQVKKFMKNYPYYNIEAHPDNDMVVFKHDEENSFTAEELMAMILENAKQNAVKFAEQDIKEAVITVPPFATQAQRRSLIRAANLAGINVLQLINDNTAVALNYGIFRRKEFNSTAMQYMFVDMGSSSTTATVVSYQVVKEKSKVTGIVDSFPQLTVKGVGYNANLGAMDFRLRLRDHLAKEFNKQKKTSTDVTTNMRSMQKLLAEAGRVMQVLSANTAHFAQVESLLDDQDFRLQITRDEFEAMCSDLIDQVDAVIQEAKKTSELVWEEINEVILMGGGSRIPKVQEMIKKSTGRSELGKSVNTDEAAALGAVYQAAHLSKGFKVKKFAIKEANLYPIQVEFERIRPKEDLDSELESKLVKRVLFGRMNPYPQKKVMTFNKHTQDFKFAVTYGDLDFMTSEEIATFGNKKLFDFSLNGIGDAYTKNIEKAESKGVKAHFKVDESGLLTLDRVESIFERTITPEEQEAEEKAANESTLSKIGNTISNLFGSSEEEAKPAEEPEKKPESEEVKKEENAEQKMEEEKGTEEVPAEDKKEEEEKEGETKEDTKDEEAKKDEKSEDKKDVEGEKKEEKKEEEKKEKKNKISKIVEEIKFEGNLIDVQDPSTEAIKASEKKLAEMRKKDEQKKKLMAITNEIEAFIFTAQDNIYQEPYEKCSTEEQREVIRSTMSEASDWLFDQDDDTELKVYEAKLKSLKEVTKELYERVKEAEERPRAMEALNSVMNYTQYFLVGMVNYTGEDQPFTKVEMETLAKLIVETEEWNKTVQAEQAKTPSHEKPRYTVEDVARKINDLDREVKYLINKAKTFKPKVKVEKKTNETKTVETKEKAEKDESKTEEKIEEPEPVAEPSKEEEVVLELPEAKDESKPTGNDEL